METAKSRLARGYSRSAPVYDALAGHLYVQGIRRLLPRLRRPPMAAILDVGCGTGLNLIEAARWLAPTGLLCGIDISPGMVEVARAKTAALGLPAIITVGDAERLPYPDAAFDLVICNSVLHWFHDRAAALREMNRVLRPGGQVAIICASGPAYREWFELVDRLTATLPGRRHAGVRPALPTAAEVAALLGAAGFLTEHLANPSQLQPINSPERYVRIMSTVAPNWAADLTPQEQALLEQMAVRAIRSVGPLRALSTWSAVEAVATKPL